MNAKPQGETELDEDRKELAEYLRRGWGIEKTQAMDMAIMILANGWPKRKPSPGPTQEYCQPKVWPEKLSPSNWTDDRTEYIEGANAMHDKFMKIINGGNNGE